MHANTSIAHSKTGGSTSEKGAKERRIRAKAHGVVIKAHTQTTIWFVVILLLVSTGEGHAADMHGVVDSILSKYQNAGHNWVVTLKNAATTLFWILATISLSWTCISMGIKRAEMGEFFAELCRFIMFTGFFFWLLTNGPDFANRIIASLRQVGGDAAGTGKSIYPGDLITLGMQVFQNAVKHINFLSVESMAVPVVIALIILIVCALIAVNMILLLCAAWVVLYAGIIFLGFGGCRWTSDMAINYYRTVLGVGVSLMTMQLIIGLGIKFLQDLVATTGESLDAPSLAIIMVACIILAVIAHRLPQMVAGMVAGGGNNGAVGGIGMMTLVGAGVAGTSIIRSVGTGAGAAAVSEGAVASYKLLQERIAAAEAATAAGSGGSRMQPTVMSNPLGGIDSSRPSANGGVGGLRSNSGPTGTSQQTGANDPKSRTNTTPAKDNEKKQSTSSNQTGVETANEPPSTRPITPDEQRGFDPPGEPFDWEAERRRRKSGQ